ncbi:hypothetical protein H5410_025951 [Solanum commersonii]|uniref:Uncharacterized protein n=1 Tax=Solanum commersonii TaxID=4109 RepID=A0A9J5YUN4_SOLCO|nr:hypothetical protein H5410_025951 [Solanum commersonii]
MEISEEEIAFSVTSHLSTPRVSSDIQQAANPFVSERLVTKLYSVESRISTLEKTLIDLDKRMEDLSKSIEGLKILALTLLASIFNLIYVKKLVTTKLSNPQRLNASYLNTDKNLVSEAIVLRELEQANADVVDGVENLILEGSVRMTQFFQRIEDIVDTNCKMKILKEEIGLRFGAVTSHLSTPRFSSDIQQSADPYIL